MTKNVIVKIILAGVAMYGTYKLLKAVDEKQKEEAEKVNKHREAVLDEIDGELHDIVPEADVEFLLVNFIETLLGVLVILAI